MNRTELAVIRIWTGFAWTGKLLHKKIRSKQERFVFWQRFLYQTFLIDSSWLNTIISRFKPVFAQGNADFHLAGHDHSLEYIAPPGERTQYFVSGRGSEARPLVVGPSSRFAKPSPGFLAVTLYTDKANLYFIDNTGVVLYQNQVTK